MSKMRRIFYYANWHPSCVTPNTLCRVLIALLLFLIWNSITSFAQGAEPPRRIVITYDASGSMGYQNGSHEYHVTREDHARICRYVSQLLLNGWNGQSLGSDDEIKVDEDHALIANPLFSPGSSWAAYSYDDQVKTLQAPWSSEKPTDLLLTSIYPKSNPNTNTHLIEIIHKVCQLADEAGPGTPYIYWVYISDDNADYGSEDKEIVQRKDEIDSLATQYNWSNPLFSIKVHGHGEPTEKIPQAVFPYVKILLVVSKKAVILNLHEMESQLNKIPQPLRGQSEDKLRDIEGQLNGMKNTLVDWGRILPTLKPDDQREIQALKDRVQKLEQELAVLKITPTPTPSPTPTQTPTPAPPPPKPHPSNLVVHAAQEMLSLRAQDGKLVSDQFKVSIEGQATSKEPLPKMTARLLTAKGELIDSGIVSFGEGATLPTDGRLVFASFSMKQQKIPAMVALALTTGSQATYASISPTKLLVQLKRGNGSIIFAFLVVGLLAVAVGALIHYFKTHAPPQRARITLVLNPGSLESPSMCFDLPPNDSYTIGQDFRDAKWFDSVQCLPWTLVYKRKPWDGEVILSNQQTGEERPIPVLADDNAHEELLLKEMGGGLRTWKLLVKVGVTEPAGKVPETKPALR